MFLYVDHPNSNWLLYLFCLNKFLKHEYLLYPSFDFLTFLFNRFIDIGTEGGDGEGYDNGHHGAGLFVRRVFDVMEFTDVAHDTSLECCVVLMSPCLMQAASVSGAVPDL